MAGRAEQVDDSFLDEVAPDDSFLDEVPADPQAGSEYGLAFQTTGAPDESQTAYTRERSLPERVARGVLQEVPFKEEAGAGIEALWEKARGNPEAMLDLYRRFKGENDAFFEDERVKNRTAGKVASVFGAAPAYLAASAALPGGMAATGAKAVGQGALLGAVQGVDDSGADLTQGEFGEAAGDAAGGAARGAAMAYLLPKAINAVLSPVSSAAKMIGKHMQRPTKIIENVGGWLGKKEGVAEHVGDKVDLPTSLTASKRIKDARANVAAAEKNHPRIAGVMDDSGNFSTSDPEVMAEIAALRELATDDQLAKNYPNLKGRTADRLDAAKYGATDKPKPSFTEAEKAKWRAPGANEEVATSRAKVAQPSSGMGEGTKRAANREAVREAGTRDLNAADKRSGYDARWKGGMSDEAAARHAADYRKEFPNASEDEVAQWVAEAADYNNTDARFMDRKRMGRVESEPAESVFSEAEQATKTQARPSDPAKVERLQSVLDNFKASKAKYKSTSDAINQAVSETEREAVRVGAVGKKSADDLRAVGVGRKFMGSAPGASTMIHGFDMYGAVGQRLTKVQSLAERFAKDDTPLGRAARWAIESDGKNKAARLLTFAKLAHDSPEMEESTP